MTKKSALWIFGLLLVCGSVLIGAGYLELMVMNGRYEQGRVHERAIWQQSAIEANVAIFNVDKRTGITTFEYLKPDQPEIHQQKAILAKVAEYRINSETGERSFVFTPPPAVKPLPVLPLPKKETGGLSLRIPEPPADKME